VSRCWWCAALVMLLTCWTVRAEDPAPATAVQVADAVGSLLTRGAPAFKIQPTPRHPLARDADERFIWASEVVVAAGRYDVPPLLLTAVAYREGSYRHTAEGARGERSTWQIMPRVARQIAAGRVLPSPVPDCTLSTPAGAALCAAALLRAGHNRCGDWGGALVYYATGSRCDAGDSGQLKFLQRDRLGLWAHLRRWMS
jgi:hypothetical protein